MRGPPGPPVCPFIVFLNLNLWTAAPSSNIWHMHQLK